MKNLIVAICALGIVGWVAIIGGSKNAPQEQMHNVAESSPLMRRLEGAQAGPFGVHVSGGIYNYNEREGYESAVFLNGVLHGPYEYREYYGKTGLKCSYRKGLLDGEYESWYNKEEDKKAVKCYFKNGKLDGLCEIWDQSGNLWESVVYKNGKVVKRNK